MTLLVATVNPNEAVMLADRRLSNVGGGVSDREMTKLANVRLRDSRFACGFAGLATDRDFVTMQWLLQSLVELAPPYCMTHPTLNALAERATMEISTLRPLEDVDRRLSILFVGYLYRKDRQFAATVLISNHESLDGPPRAAVSPEFQLYSQTWPCHDGSPNNATTIAVGAESAVDPALLLGGLGAMSGDSGRPWVAADLVATGRDVIRDAHTRDEAVGDDVSYVVVPRDLDAAPTAGYAPVITDLPAYYPAEMFALGPDGPVGARGAIYEARGGIRTGDSWTTSA